MRRGLLIVGGLVIIVLIALWVYILFFSGNTDGPGRFSDFFIGDTTDQTIPADQLNDVASEPIVDVTSDTGPLRQLTTRPVVGYREVVASASSSPLIYFVESGTGHIYTINLTTGEENRVSNITVPNVTKAVVSHNGTFVALQTPNAVSIIDLPSITDAKPTSFTLSETVTDIAVTNTDTLLYAVDDGAGVTAKSFDMRNKTVETTLFTVPFREVVINWSESTGGPHYYYPKPDKSLLGYLYSVKDGVTTRLPASGYGFTAVGNKRYVVYSKVAGEKSLFFIYDTIEKNTADFSIPLFAYKCTVSNAVEDFAVCALPKESSNLEDLSSWLRGETVHTDALWFINLPQHSMFPVVEEGLIEKMQDIDIADIALSEQVILFKDKKTGYLWAHI